MYRLTGVEPEKIKEYQEKYGGFNDFPPNWEEIDEIDFWPKFMGGFGFMYQQHRQMIATDDLGRRYTTHAVLYFYRDGTGVALIQQVEKARITRPRFAKFALCKHEYVERNIGRCLHEYKCKKCGYKYEVDSSD